MLRPFEQLGKIGQSRRLRALAQVALTHFPIGPARLHLINDYFNTLFRVDAAHARYVLRVHRTRSRTPDGLRAELEWLSLLAAMPGAPPVPRPVSTHDGRQMIDVAHPGVPEPRTVSLFHWQEGRILGDALTPAHTMQLGRITRWLHDHADAFRPLEPLAPRGDTLYDGEPEVLWSWPTSPTLRARLQAAHERCVGLFECYADRPRQLCHMDLHPGNLLRTASGLALLDFDDSGVTWPAYDLGISAFYLRVLPKGAALLDGLRAGYGPAFPPDEDLYGFTLARQLRLLNSLLQETDPRMRGMVPEYLHRVEQRLGRWLGEGA